MISLICEPKKTPKLKQNKKPYKLIDTENRLVLARSEGMWKMGEWDQKAQTSSYKVSHRDIMYSMVTAVNNTVLHT